ncbi:MAG: hypothetical protein DRI84_04105 [Bacteroidetes bacterium]|nr:MAG: hypothetical protein DRI84_04105 [Bacteroidota bacterium]
MRNIRVLFVLISVLGLLFSVSCSKEEENPEDFVKDLEHDPNVIGFWIGYVDAKFETIQGKLKVIVSDSSEIYPAVSEYHSSGADFSYSLKQESGHYIHEYNPSSQMCNDYWYSGPLSSTERVVYDVYSTDGVSVSSRVDFEYQIYNVDTLIINSTSGGGTRLLVRIEDPSKIPSTLKIKE